MIETMRLHTTIAADGVVKVEVPSKLPPGPAEVVLVIASASPANQLRWRDFYGIAKELWGDQDAQEYVNRLREEWN